MHSLTFLKKLYVDKDYDKLLNSDEFDLESRAKTFLMTGIFEESAKLYNQLKMSFEEGYCYLLLGNIDQAEIIWNDLGDENPWLLWGRSLIEILRGELQNYPTYLQLRNFMEVEMSIFLKFGRNDLFDKVLGALEVLKEINPECYKYVGRVLLNCGQARRALYYLSKFCDINFNDPEIQYLLAKCYVELGFTGLAHSAIANCLNIAPNYYPAVSFFDGVDK